MKSVAHVHLAWMHEFNIAM